MKSSFTMMIAVLFAVGCITDRIGGEEQIATETGQLAVDEMGQEVAGISEEPLDEPQKAEQAKRALEAVETGLTTTSCNWNGGRWLSHGWDNKCAWRTGVWAYCFSGQITSMYWEEGCSRYK